MEEQIIAKVIRYNTWCSLLKKEVDQKLQIKCLLLKSY